MSLSDLLLAAAILAVLVGITAEIGIVSFLQRRGFKTPFLFQGYFMFRNLKKYREETAKESGRPGPLYVIYISSFLCALILAAAGLLLKRLPN
jgi:hypothetical protein